MSEEECPVLWKENPRLTRPTWTSGRLPLCLAHDMAGQVEADHVAPTGGGGEGLR